MILLLLSILIFSLIGCGGNNKDPLDTNTNNNQVEDPTNPPEEADKAKDDFDGIVWVLGDDITEGDEGVGPGVIRSDLGDLYIPEGIKFEISYGYEFETQTIQVYLGKNNLNTLLKINTVYDFNNLEETVDYTLNWYTEEGTTSESKDMYRFGNLDFQYIEFDGKYGKDHVLVSFYERDDGGPALFQIDVDTSDFNVNDQVFDTIVKNSKFR